jgi:DNA-binding transcriptional ArsR family regulator
MMFSALDPVLHSQVRLAVVSLLMGIESAEFSYLLECTQTTKGNLSFQLAKLKEAGYIEISKSFRGNYPLTTCRITRKGAEAFETYVRSISEYLKKSPGPDHTL